MNIMPKWMYDKIVEHLDRHPTYVEVRGKIISLSQTQTGENIQQVETPPIPSQGQWGTEYDEESGCSWKWLDGPEGSPLQDQSSTSWEDTDINALNGP